MSGWLIVALFGVAGEQYFFFMQRSALEVCRARDLPANARFALLPDYYSWGRIPSIAKWIGAVGLAFSGSWGVAAIVLIGALLISSVFPVPHSAFFEVFYRELDDPSNDAPEEVRELMRSALKAVDREHGVTGRGSDG